MIISNEKCRAELNEHGEMISFKIGEEDYIWSGEARFWNGHAPTLFPYCGRIKNERALYNGREFSGQTIHGFARKQTHTLIKSGRSNARFELCENAQTLERYPYPFKLETEYVLMKNGYGVRFTVTNTGTESMPFSIGSHPAYMIPGEIGDCDLFVEGTENALYYANDEDGLFRGDLVMGQVRAEGLPLSYSLFRRRGMIFPSLDEHKRFTVKNRVTGRGFSVSFDDFPVCVMWMSHEDCPFICVEPWHGLPDESHTDGCFEKKFFVITLGAGESRSLSYYFEAING